MSIRELMDNYENFQQITKAVELVSRNRPFSTICSEEMYLICKLLELRSKYMGGKAEESQQYWADAAEKYRLEYAG